jgi:hypothetical protein
MRQFDSEQSNGLLFKLQRISFVGYYLGDIVAK